MEIVRPETRNKANRQVTSTRNYKLNIDKAIRGKLKSCSNAKTEYAVTGGGITGVMDTARFELFRSACSAFFKKLPPSEGRCLIDISEDKMGRAVVQQTYKVRECEVNGQLIGYTLNLYITNNTILINGRALDKFVSDHLPVIHELMCKAIREGEFDDLQHLNVALAQELKCILDLRQRSGSSDSSRANTSTPPSPTMHVRQTNGNNNSQRSIQSSSVEILSPGPRDGSNHSPQVSTPIPSPRASSSRQHSATIVSSCVEAHTVTKESATLVSPTKSTSEPENIKCAKCKKNCVSRAAICEIGNHWVHYRCDKLTPDEIQMLTSNTDYIYNCKACRADSNTVLKTPYTSSPSDHEEAPNNNTVLKIPFMPPPSAGCHTAHIMNEETGGTITCGACNLTVTDNETACGKCNALCHQKCINMDICTACAATDSQLSLQNEACAATDSQLSFQNEVEPDTIFNPQSVPVQPRSTGKGPQTITNTIKQRELRQLELKLKKWETELKVKDTEYADREKENRRLEDYLRKTEARNNELEHTVRTLNRRIDLLESASSNSSGEPKVNLPNARVQNTQQQSTQLGTEDLIHSVHGMVTKFVINKVAQQLRHMETLDIFSNSQQTPVNPNVTPNPSYANQGISAPSPKSSNVNHTTQPIVPDAACTSQPTVQPDSYCSYVPQNSGSKATVADDARPNLQHQEVRPPALVEATDPQPRLPRTEREPIAESLHTDQRSSTELMGQAHTYATLTAGKQQPDTARNQTWGPARQQPWTAKEPRRLAYHAGPTHTTRQPHYQDRAQLLANHTAGTPLYYNPHHQNHTSQHFLSQVRPRNPPR